MSISGAPGWASSGPLPVVIVGFLIASTIAALLPRSRANPGPLSLVFSAIACLAIFVLGASVIATGVPVTLAAGDVLGFALVHARFDSLGGLFLIALGLVGMAASVYGIGYGAHEGANVDRTAAAYPVFLASLVLVFGADDAFAFLFAWELMALASALLVVGSRPSAEVARAGYVYFALT